MTLYRAMLILFLSGNIALFTAYMRITSQPWEAALVFLGYIYANGPIAVSVFTARKIDETLKGHWLNWFNILIPIAVGSTGLFIYGAFALKPDAHPAIFFNVPLIITMGWSILFALLVNIFVLIPHQKPAFHRTLNPGGDW